MWFKKKRQSGQEITVPVSPHNRVEIELAKDANKNAKEKALAVNSHVEDLLVQNGFTLKIVLAAYNPNKEAK